MGVAIVLLGRLAAWAYPPQGTDDELLKNLEARPIDRYDHRLRGEEPNEDASPAGESVPKPEQDAALQKELQRELGAAGQSEDANPLVRIAERMHELQAPLARNDGGHDTQEAQQKIVAELDQLLAKAKKNCSQCKGGPCDKQAKADCNSPGQSCDKPGLKSGSRPGKNPGERNKSDLRAAWRPIAPTCPRCGRW